MSSSKMSQPVKTRSLSPVSGTNSFTFGVRPSVRLPRRTVPICVMEPIGFACPLRTASTPATNVVATAPIPGIMIPNLPLAGAMLSEAVFFSFAILGSLLLVNFRGEVQKIYVLVTRVDLQTGNGEHKGYEENSRSHEDFL